MSPNAQRVKELFVAALEMPESASRTAFLDRECRNDDRLRSRIDALLHAHNHPESALERPLGVPAGVGDTRTGPPAPVADDPLDFLDPSDKPGSIGRLGHYEVQEVVGRGGMGVVLKAFDENLHRVVAIKVMAPQLATSATARQRFTREARAAAAVTHDHVVTIHAVEDAGPLPYIVMQFVAGTSLQDRLDRTGPLQLHEVLRIGMQTASGLAAAHAQGLVHRDVKPANILLENGVERVKLTDFGLARAADDASLTQSGTIAGTPHYMSPEQAEGKPLDHRSDLFSLGSVLYAMCTGRPPFRAGTNMGVLKRVCEEVPTPIRETNPEVPDWLAGVVEKLHAKDPAARFQSAAEVAEVLGRHLAHVQHPSVVPLPIVLASGGREPPVPAGTLVSLPPTRHRWAVAAAVLVAVLATLGTTEATRLTNVRAAMIRIFTPEGPLVVETNDPAVKPEAPPAAPVAKAEPGAFVLLAAGEERKFDTLAEAVQGTSDGDTIEVRGNGPFVSEPIKINSALTIRAGKGFRPVIKLSPEGLQARAHLFDTKAPLVLEGLELQRVAQERGEGSQAIVMATKALHVANCRFLMRNTDACISPNSPVCELQNCEFIGCREAGEDAVMTYNLPNRRLVIDNCLHATSAAGLFLTGGEPNAFVQLTRNTFRTRFSLALGGFSREKLLKIDEANQQVKFVHVDASSNVFDGASSVFLFVEAPPGTTISQADAESFCKRRLGWKGERNLYALNGPLVNLNLAWKFLDPANPVRTLADWRRFWGTTEADSVEGRVRYKGGDLLGKADLTPEQLTPDDFRLRADSAGYKAGKDGKDLGADVDLVGPGPAYERWKKTPEYQQWLKDTKQVK